MGLGPPGPELPKSTLPDSPEARAAVAIAKSAAAASRPTAREAPAARAAGKVIPFPSSRKEGEGERRSGAEPAAQPDGGQASARRPPRPPRPPRARSDVRPAAPSEVRAVASPKPEERSRRRARTCRARRPRPRCRAPRGPQPGRARWRRSTSPAPSLPATGSRRRRATRSTGTTSSSRRARKGRYEGGPARPLGGRRGTGRSGGRAAVQRISRTPEQEQRRARNIRVVAGVVGFLLAVFAVAVWRSGAFHGASGQEPVRSSVVHEKEQPKAQPPKTGQGGPAGRGARTAKGRADAGTARGAAEGGTARGAAEGGAAEACRAEAGHARTDSDPWPCITTRRYPRLRATTPPPPPPSTGKPPTAAFPAP